VLDGHIIGFSLWQNSHSYPPISDADVAAIFDRMIPADVYPYLREHGEQHLAEGPHREVDAFEFGLDLILDGLKKLPVVP
jgi:hypothetical protein